MKKILSLVCLAWSVAANAQFTPGQILTAAELNNQFSLYAPLSGAAFIGGVSGPSFSGALSGPHNGSVGAISPSTGVFTNLTATGTVALPPGAVPLSGLASQSANTVVANATGSSASPTAIAVPSCSTSSSALQWTSGSGFLCNSNIANLGGSTFSGLVTLSSGLTISGGTITGVHGRLLNIQVFTSSGTYTPTTGTNSIVAEVQAAGGGSGGTPATSAGQSAVGSSAGAGSYAEAYFTSVSSQTVTIGGIGTGGAAGANAGTSALTSSFGSLISCPGGFAGSAGAATSAAVQVGPTAAAAACTVTGATVTLQSVPGGSSQPGIVVTAGSVQLSGSGGNSFFGQGGQGRAFTNSGFTAVGYGAGAGGANATASSPAQAGGNGGPAIIIVYEYS